MKTLESKIKPELKRAFGVIERNQEYLREHNILGEKKTLKRDLENFYDLEYHKEGDPFVYNALGLGEENKDKYGKKPEELIKILDEFPTKSDDGENESSSNLLTYEKVRDSFYEPEFPSWKSNVHFALGLTGAIGCTISMAHSMKADYFPNFAWSVPFTLLSAGMFMYGPIKDIKERIKFAKENFSEERENIQNNFQKLYNTAKEMDKFVMQYNSLFEN